MGISGLITRQNSPSNVGYVEYEPSELFARNMHYVDYGEVKPYST